MKKTNRGRGRIALTLATFTFALVASFGCDVEGDTDGPQMEESEGTEEALGEEASDGDGDREGDLVIDEASPTFDPEGGARKFSCASWNIPRTLCCDSSTLCDALVSTCRKIGGEYVDLSDGAGDVGYCKMK